MALATPNQLYRLNKLGRLVVQPHAVPMTHVDADREIKKAMGTYLPYEDAPEVSIQHSGSVEIEALFDGLAGGTREAS